jgi:hypothetical protein
MVNGKIPEGMCIDHLNGDGLDNRIVNLRVTTLSGNQRNRRVSNSRTGVSGVVHHGNGKGFNVVCAGEYIGYFTEIQNAVSARQQAEKVFNYHDRK